MEAWYGDEEVEVHTHAPAVIVDDEPLIMDGSVTTPPADPSTAPGKQMQQQAAPPASASGTTAIRAVQGRAGLSPLVACMWPLFDTPGTNWASSSPSSSSAEGTEGEHAEVESPSASDQHVLATLGTRSALSHVP